MDDQFTIRERLKRIEDGIAKDGNCFVYESFRRCYLRRLLEAQLKEFDKNNDRDYN